MARRKNKSLNELNDEYNNMNTLLNNNDLSIEEQIKIIEQYKSKLLLNYNKGKKIYTSINGEKVFIAKSIVDKYRKTCKLLESKKNIQSNSKNRKIHNIDVTPVLTNDEKLYQQLLNNLKDVEEAINRSPLLKEQYKSLKERLNDPNISIHIKINMMRQFINQNLIIINFLNGKIKRNEDEIQKTEDVVFEDLTGYEEKEDKVIEIEEVKKPKSKSKLKSAFKRITASIAAALVLVAGSIVLKNYTEIAKKPVEKTSNVQSTTSFSRTNHKKVVRAVNKNSKNPTINHTVKKQTKIAVKKINNIHYNSYLGRKFILKKNSLIYSSVLNASQNTNGYTSYYSNKDTRKVVGYGLRYQSKLVGIIQVDKDSYKIINNNKEMHVSKKEAESKIVEIINKGGKIESVASLNMNHQEGVEGFYNYKNLILK